MEPMTRQRLPAMTIIIMLAASPVAGSPVAVWSGAGPNACNGRCTQAWAETLLTDAQRAELRDVMQHQPLPEAVWVEDGAYMPVMTYWRDGNPHGVRGSTVAVLDRPEHAIGWQMSDWTFARLDACRNWAVISRSTASTGGTRPTLFGSSGQPLNDRVASSLTGSGSSAGGAGILPYLLPASSREDGIAAPSQTAMLPFPSPGDTSLSATNPSPAGNAGGPPVLASSKAGQTNPPFPRPSSRNPARSASFALLTDEAPLPVVSLPASGPILVFALAGLICLRSRRTRRRLG